MRLNELQDILVGNEERGWKQLQIRQDATAPSAQVPEGELAHDPRVDENPIFLEQVSDAGGTSGTSVEIDPHRRVDKDRSIGINPPVGDDASGERWHPGSFP